MYNNIYMNNSVKQVKFLKQLVVYLNNKLNFHEYINYKISYQGLH